jgi:hypothetical protein
MSRDISQWIHTLTPPVARAVLDGPKPNRDQSLIALITTHVNRAPRSM